MLSMKIQAEEFDPRPFVFASASLKETIQLFT